MTRAQDLIFSITSLLRKLEPMYSLDQLDPQQKDMLFFIGEAEIDGSALKVTDLVKEGRFGTGPTVYGRLSELQDTGWITTVPDASDGRAKRVFLSPGARKKFSKISQHISQRHAGQHG